MSIGSQLAIRSDEHRFSDGRRSDEHTVGSQMVARSDEYRFSDGRQVVRSSDVRQVLLRRKSAGTSQNNCGSPVAF